MGLVWIRAPFSTELKAMFFNIIPFCLLHHELPPYFVLSLFPVNSRIQDHDNYVIHSDVASDESKPILSHTSELILILDETIIIEFIFVKGTLLIELDLVLRP